MWMLRKLLTVASEPGFQQQAMDRVGDPLILYGGTVAFLLGLLPYLSGFVTLAYGVLRLYFLIRDEWRKSRDAKRHSDPEET
jgi:hypothetical protein